MDDVVVENGVARCWWATESPEYRPYHDKEWGFPVTEDARLFEFLSLQEFRAGLSWEVVFHKREALRSAFADFDYERVAGFGKRDVKRLLSDSDIIRNRRKIEAVIDNAQMAVELAEQEGSLAHYLWRFEPRQLPVPKNRADLRKLSASPEGMPLVKDLKARGWRFVGPTTIYTFMQVTGLIDNHLEGCDVRAKIEKRKGRLRRP
ncbi:MAG TPA: DNA-3-methyladenine glycosylase I [Solirubrobacterales bacterium]|nr:DNA-3-methyladenine glycosylase I [Solirubrobacterales bacterium]